MKRIVAVKPVYYDGTEGAGFRIAFNPEEEILAVIKKEEFNALPDDQKPQLVLNYVFESLAEQRAFEVGAGIAVATGMLPDYYVTHGILRPIPEYKSDFCESQACQFTEAEL